MTGIRMSIHQPPPLVHPRRMRLRLSHSFKWTAIALQTNGTVATTTVGSALPFPLLDGAHFLPSKAGTSNPPATRQRQVQRSTVAVDRQGRGVLSCSVSDSAFFTQRPTRPVSYLLAVHAQWRAPQRTRSSRTQNTRRFQML